MLPGQVLSSTVMRGDYLSPDDSLPTLIIDYELGGVALQDPSQGLQVKTWTAYIDGQDIKILAADVAVTTLFTRPGVLTEVSLAFDQNMRPTVAFVEDGVAIMYWFDSFVGTPVFTTFAGASSPRVCLDDKRPLEVATCDTLLAYIKTNNLYFRAQRDRFLVEYLLQSTVNASLVMFGMTDVNRVQFMLELP